jgi:hypothetical protein
MASPHQNGRSRDAAWIFVAILALLVVGAWPPQGERSLAAKFVNWAVDPMNRLPVLPDPLPVGLGDDPAAVEAHDAEARFYDDMYRQGGWTRRRLEWKVARDPFNPSTTRQLLTAAAVLFALYAWRLGSRKD